MWILFLPVWTGVHNRSPSLSIQSTVLALPTLGLCGKQGTGCSRPGKMSGSFSDLLLLSLPVMKAVTPRSHFFPSNRPGRTLLVFAAVGNFRDSALLHKLPGLSKSQGLRYIRFASLRDWRKEGEDAYQNFFSIRLMGSVRPQASRACPAHMTVSSQGGYIPMRDV